ncbi:MAG TPA: hypothetical protein VL443_08285 [Cyclobacteriaceae bacterium]|jgi:hypothetical protein|nr:hypothetical protein [Cyclobacteriaceae bacterium]
MTFIPMSDQNIQLMLQSDAQQWRNTILWLEQRCKSYNQNLTVDAMNAVGISTDNQNIILAFIADLNRAYSFASGTMPAVADDMLFDCTAVLGIL